jgi:hypothetical protein
MFYWPMDGADAALVPKLDLGATPQSTLSTARPMRTGPQHKVPGPPTKHLQSLYLFFGVFRFEIGADGPASLLAKNISERRHQDAAVMA